jgi:L-seryl-tRNA(Ser) seleniumtransferase
MRALRVDKITLSALGALFQILVSSRSPEKEIPTLDMIARPLSRIRELVSEVCGKLQEQAQDKAHFEILDGESQIGGGSCPAQSLPTSLLGIRIHTMSPAAVSFRLRMGTPPIIGIIRNDTFCLDFRTIQPEETPEIIVALINLVNSE